MERHDRSPLATFLADRAPAPGQTAVLGADAAHHARVKRLAVGDAVQLTDGAGTMGTGEISAVGRDTLTVRVAAATFVPRPAPIHLRAPIADRDRMLWLAEKATELGIASWQAIRFRRSMSVSPRGEGLAFAAKVRARMRSALEQSGGAWLPDVLPDAPLESLTLREGEAGLLLDASGAPIGGLVRAGNDSATVVLVGPEGGVEDTERDALVRGGWLLARLAETTLRFETAAVAAIAVARAITL